MLLPSLQEKQKTVQSVSDFLGYNHNLVINENEFYNTKNITTDLYPVMTQRNQRGTIRKMNRPNGIFAKGKLCWVDGTDVYYDGNVVGQVTDGKKQFASMGAYLLIFPDKAMYNTADGTFTKLENIVEITGDIKIEKANMSDSQQNTTEYSTFAKITAEGIGVGFKQYDGVTISGLPQEDLNKNAIIQELEDDYILIIGDVKETIETTGTVKVERKVPDMEFFTESENRLWGCSSEKHEIYSCKLGDPTNWYAYEGISTDSYAVTIGSDGDFTGACTYLGYVLFFKEDTIHKIMGNKPSNYQVTGTKARGVEKGSEQSLIIVNETLYYKARTGIVAYQGASATSIAEAFGNVSYKNAVAGAYGNKYYVSMTDGREYSLFCYDERKGLWCREDETQMLFTAYYENMLYYIDSDGNLKSIEGNDEDPIEWEAESGDIILSYGKKYISRMSIRVEMEKRSFMDIFVKYDEEKTWERVKTIRAVNNRNYEVPIRPKRFDHMRVKMKGTGRCRVYGLEKQFEIGSEVNVRIK